MAKTASDVVHSKIEIVDQLEEVRASQRPSFWLLFAVIFASATITFVVIRRIAFGSTK